MSLEKNIEEKLKASLKNKDKTVYPTLRLIISSIKDFKIAQKIRENEIKDNDVISILKKMVKQRNDSSDAYQKAGRQDLLDKEKEEIKIIEEFLPKQLSEDDTKKICNDAIKNLKAESMKDMGKIMATLKKSHGDVLDFSKVSKIIKEILK
jgi:uncharacterized protein YqeY|tara:strand:+ start:116 stop:568 length:453 start_codon:yes stop_codon:yes gene_type:complete